MSERKNNIPWWANNYPFPSDDKKPALIRRENELYNNYGRGNERMTVEIFISTDKILMSAWISGDNYPNDPERWQKEGAGSEDVVAAEKEALVYLSLFGLLIVIILTVLVFIFFMINWMRTKKNKQK